MSNNPNNPNEYNGYPNYETWAVALWIDNEQGASRYWNGRAAELLADPPADDSDIFTPQERALYALAGELQEEHEQRAEELLTAGNAAVTVFADLVNSALGRVDWRYIAENMLEDAAEE